MIDHLTWFLPAEALERVVAQYRRAFRMRIAGSDQTTAGASVANSYVLTGPMTLVLVAPDPTRHRPGGPIDQFLSLHRNAGVHHIAFRTRDIVAAARLHVHSGAKWMPAPDGYYDHIPELVAGCPPVRARLSELRALGVLVDRDDDGLLYQIVAASPHGRGALHYEFIQREGSTGFGRRNARALLAH